MSKEFKSFNTDEMQWKEILNEKNWALFILQSIRQVLLTQSIPSTSSWNIRAYGLFTHRPSAYSRACALTIRP
jgi:hypothetical protein